MPIKKRATTKRKTTAKRKTRITGIASYVKKVFSSPGVKKVSATIKSLEAKLKAAKRKKATAVKAARKKLK
jgi:methylmalonyl-CoA mutase N-terminal domain/subunit